MRRMVVCSFAALLCASCASTSDVLGKRYNRAAVCFVPSPPDGMHKVRPSAEDANAVWQALDLGAADHIYYWFEDSVGNASLGITDGTNDWEVELMGAGTSYVVKTPDWRNQQLVCIG